MLGRHGSNTHFYQRFTSFSNARSHNALGAVLGSRGFSALPMNDFDVSCLLELTDCFKDLLFNGDNDSPLEETWAGANRGIKAHQEYLEPTNHTAFDCLTIEVRL